MARGYIDRRSFSRCALIVQCVKTVCDHNYQKVLNADLYRENIRFVTFIMHLFVRNGCANAGKNIRFQLSIGILIRE